jgi:hypothetical protein
MSQSIVPKSTQEASSLIKTKKYVLKPLMVPQTLPQMPNGKTAGSKNATEIYSRCIYKVKK